MWEIVRAGGPFMWPIIICSIALVGIVLERLWTLQRKRVLPQELIKKVSELAERNQVSPKVIEALEKNSPLGRVLAAALANRHRGRDIMMERVEDAGRHVVHELERFVNSVGTIASISPLLGLLGTVTGIIRAFNAIMLGGMGDPRMLAGGISEALICTAAGLTVAIPAYIAHRYLRGKVERIVIEMEKIAVNFADSLGADTQAGDSRRRRRAHAHEVAVPQGEGRSGDQPDPADRRRAAAGHLLHAVVHLHAGRRASRSSCRRRASRPPASRRPIPSWSRSRRAAAIASTTAS